MLAQFGEQRTRRGKEHDMKRFVRQLMPNQEFTLLRTGEKYTFLRRDIQTPSGIRYVVIKTDPFIKPKDGVLKETTLHHACHVWVKEPA